MSMSVSRARQAILLVPLGYLLSTRARTARDLFYLIGSTWLPGLWIAWRLSDLSVPHSIAAFALGYLAFVAIYEIGYLANDSWDAARGGDGRQRLGFRPGPGFVAVFLVIRAAVWLIIGIGTGWLHDAVWLAGFAALAAAFTLHNLLRRPGNRIASFVGLATLRFVLPVIAVVPRDRLLTVLLIALICYTHLRTLSYMDSKQLLDLPDRRQAWFGLVQLAILAPLALFAALLAQSAVVVEVYVYFIALYLAPWVIGRARTSSAR